MTMTPNPGNVKKPTASDIAYWMGRVDGQLIELVTSIKSLSGRVEKVEQKLEELDDQGKAPPAKPVESEGITFKWLVEKALLPVVMLLVGGIISWIMARGLP